MREQLDFGKLGLKAGDCITLVSTGHVVMVAASADGSVTGSTLVRYCRSDEHVLWTLSAITRRILGTDFDPRADIWSLWLWRGHTLRELASVPVRRTDNCNTGVSE